MNTNISYCKLKIQESAILHDYEFTKINWLNSTYYVSIIYVPGTLAEYA